MDNQRPDTIEINGQTYGALQTKGLIAFLTASQQAALKGGHLDVSINFAHCVEWMKQTAGRWFGKHMLDFSVYVTNDENDTAQDQKEKAAALGQSYLEFWLPTSKDLYHIEQAEPTGTYSVTGNPEFRVTVSGTDRAISILMGALELFEAHEDVLGELLPDPDA